MSLYIHFSAEHGKKIDYKLLSVLHDISMITSEIYVLVRF